MLTISSTSTETDSSHYGSNPSPRSGSSAFAMWLGCSTDQKGAHISPLLRPQFVTCFEHWADLIQAKAKKKHSGVSTFAFVRLQLLGENARASPLEDEKHMAQWPQRPQPTTARLVCEWTQLRPEEPPSWVHPRSANPWDHHTRQPKTRRTAQTNPA